MQNVFYSIGGWHLVEFPLGAKRGILPRRRIFVEKDPWKKYERTHTKLSPLSGPTTYDACLFPATEWEVGSGDSSASADPDRKLNCVRRLTWTVFNLQVLKSLVLARRAGRKMSHHKTTSFINASAWPRVHDNTVSRIR